MSVLVRPIGARDVDPWRRLFRDYGVFYKTEFDDAQLDHVWGLLTTNGSGLDAIVAEIGGEVVGFAVYRSHPDSFSTGRDWYLDDLYTDPSARGAGVATALIERLTEWARSTGPGTLRWITAEDNVTAQRVYDRLAKRTTWVTYELRS